MSELSSQRMIPWPMTTQVDGDPDVVRDENGDVVWTEIPAPADLADDRTLVPMTTTVGGGDPQFMFTPDGEILAADVSRSEETVVDDVTGQPLVSDGTGEPLTSDD